MHLATIRELFDYSRWANERTLEAAEAVSAEDFTRPVGGSFATLQGTLEHLCGADWVWLERFHGNSPRALPFAGDLTDVAAVRARWQDVERGLAEFLDGLTEERLGTSVSYINFAGERWTYPVWQALVHVVNHSTYHRGQVTTLLRQLGVKPATTDFLRYYDAGAPK